MSGLLSGYNFCKCLEDEFHFCTNKHFDMRAQFPIVKNMKVVKKSKSSVQMENKLEADHFLIKDSHLKTKMKEVIKSTWRV